MKQNSPDSFALIVLLFSQKYVCLLPFQPLVGTKNSDDTHDLTLVPWLTRGSKKAPISFNFQAHFKRESLLIPNVESQEKWLCLLDDFFQNYFFC